MKKKDQIELDAEYARKLHEEINKDHEEINKDIDWDAAIDHAKGLKIYSLGSTNGNYIPPKPDLTFIDEQVESKYVDVVSNVTSSAVKTVESRVESVDVKNKGVGEDRLKLKELMELSTKLSDRVFDLEKIKTAQAKEIVDLKTRFKKLERKRRSITPGMNLFKIGTSRRRSLGEEDASKQGRNLKH
nr:hypothetical protein [Tanacetum cinerariifolium]